MRQLLRRGARSVRAKRAGVTSASMSLPTRPWSTVLGRRRKWLRAQAGLSTRLVSSPGSGATSANPYTGLCHLFMVGPARATARRTLVKRVVPKRSASAQVKSSYWRGLRRSPTLSPSSGLSRDGVPGSWGGRSMRPTNCTGKYTRALRPPFKPVGRSPGSVPPAFCQLGRRRKDRGPHRADPPRGWPVPHAGPRRPSGGNP